MTCSSCGANIELSNPYVKTIQCAYCDNNFYIGSESASNKATKASITLVDIPSQFRPGRTGLISGYAFEVSGRVRYSYQDGFWEEAHLWVPARSQKLLVEEDEGGLILFEEDLALVRVPTFAETRIGGDFGIEIRSGLSQRFFVSEKRRAAVSGIEGQLFELLKPGTELIYYLGSSGNRIASIRSSTLNSNIVYGKECDYDEIEWDLS